MYCRRMAHEKPVVRWEDSGEVAVSDVNEGVLSAFAEQDEFVVDLPEPQGSTDADVLLAVEEREDELEAKDEV